ncbi:MAG: ribosomal protein S18-alanine N-acetyltransferase [Magnetococcales bacterium]|nr:ribosomal protein S18-alanine N-acetyltransferase [Magnetococcales bacterium]
MTHLTCMPCTSAHLPAIVALEQRIASYPWQDSLFQDELRPQWQQQSLHYVWLAPDGCVVGFIFCRALIADEWWLLNIGMDPRLRQQGWGERLLRQVMQQSAQRGGESMLLEVAASNRPAQRLYEKCGFVVIGIRKNYYHHTGRQDDALVMQCTLPQTL